MLIGLIGYAIYRILHTGIMGRCQEEIDKIQRRILESQNGQLGSLSQSLREAVKLFDTNYCM